MSRTWKPTLLYALAHFAVDFGCAFAMFSACSTGPLGFLLYNFCAFAMQMPMGILADLLGKNRRFALLGTALVALICCLPSFGLVGCILLGLGNGLFHIGGGLDVLNLSGRRAAPLGVFVSPGAYGIYLGTILGNRAISPIPVVALLILACGGMLLWKSDQMPKNPPVEFPTNKIIPWAALLFAVVILRSYGGMAGSFSWKTGVWSLVAVSAVVFGKTLGGVAADRFGTKRTAAISLLLSAVLFLCSHAPIPGVLALFFFNMTMPITLFALSRSMPGCKGFSFGLLTFALFLGFLPTYMGAGTIGGLGMALVAAASAVLLLPGLHRLQGNFSGKER